MSLLWTIFKEEGVKMNEHDNLMMATTIVLLLIFILNVMNCALT